MSWLLVCVVCMALVAAQPTQSNPGRFNVGSVYWLSWWPDTVNGKMNITMSAVTNSPNGWIALGLTPNPGQMLDAAVTVGWMSGSTFVVSARHASNGENEPVFDGVQTATLVGGSYDAANTILSITFTRPISAGGDSFVSGGNSVIWARQFHTNPGLTPGGTLQQHDDRGSSNIDFFATPPSSSPSRTPSASPGQTITASPSGVASPSPAAGAGSRNFCTPSGFCITWVLDQANSRVTITVTGPNSAGWIAVGFTQRAGMMFPATAYIGWVSGATGFLSTRSNTANTDPSVSTDTSATLVSASVSNGATTMTFTRPLTKASGDNIVNGDTNLIFAANSGVTPSGSASAALQKHDTRDAAALNFFTGSATATTVVDVLPSRQAHGSLMFIAWIVLVPFGIIMARFFKSLGRPWFIAHVVAQTFALAFTIIAFSVIVHVIPTEQQFTGANAAHKILGLIVFILAILQFFIGILADRLWSPTRKGIPIFPDKTHWILGGLVSLLAVINCFMGLDAYGTTHNGIWAGMAVLVGLIMIAFVVLQCRVGQSHHQEPTKPADAENDGSGERGSARDRDRSSGYSEPKGDRTPSPRSSSSRGGRSGSTPMRPLNQ